MHTNATFLKEQCMHKYFPSIVVSSLMSMIPKSIDWRITNTQKRELQLLSPHIIRSFQKTWNTACKFCKKLLWQQLYRSFFCAWQLVTICFSSCEKSSMDILLNISCCHTGNYFLSTSTNKNKVFQLSRKWSYWSSWLQWWKKCRHTK